MYCIYVNIHVHAQGNVFHVYEIYQRRHMDLKNFFPLFVYTHFFVNESAVTKDFS